MVKETGWVRDPVLLPLDQVRDALLVVHLRVEIAVNREGALRRLRLLVDQKARIFILKGLLGLIVLPLLLLRDAVDDILLHALLLVLPEFVAHVLRTGNFYVLRHEFPFALRLQLELVVDVEVKLRLQLRDLALSRKRRLLVL